MIITRTPLRVSFAGGGSDLPAFCSTQRGAVLSAAIDKYMVVAVQHKFGGGVRVGYSVTENVRKVTELQHDIAREALLLLGITQSVEVVSIADVPAGTGLGSSSAYAVGLIHAVIARAGGDTSPENLARLACEVELGRCRKVIGRQDQFAAAFGGVNLIEFEGQSVRVHPVKTRHLQELQGRLLMLYVGETHDAAAILAAQAAGLEDEAKRELTAMMVPYAYSMTTALVSGALDDFGRLLGNAWQIKRQLAPGITTERVDALYEAALSAGALGGKLCGAGGAGFLLLYTPEGKRDDVLSAMQAHGRLRALPLGFDSRGSRVVYHDGRSD